MNELLKDLRERLSNFSITALFPAMQCLSETAWSEEGFADKESEDFFEEILDVAEQFIEKGDKTGIPHYVLYVGALLVGTMAEEQGNEELVNKCSSLVDRYIHESMELGLNLAYYDLGKALLLGNGIWEKDEEKGLTLIKKATEIPTIPELGMNPEIINSRIKETYEECLAQYSKTIPNNESTATTISNVSTAKKKSLIAKKKEFTAGYYQAGVAAFIGYILVSILLRIEFGWQSAYDISVEGNWLLGIGVTLILNYSIIPLLMMAYFYKKNNGKHSILLVCLYVAFLVGCYADGILPYIETGTLLEGTNLLSALLYPTVFLLSHRLLSLLIYAIIHNKEGESDYKIYYGLALFAPFMAWILIVGIIFWILQSGSGNNDSHSTRSSSEQTLDMKEYVRRELSVGIRSIGVYYDNGWKVVDYWNNGSSLSEVRGDDWRKTYLKDSKGKIYILSTNCPDKETIYYFN